MHFRLFAWSCLEAFYGVEHPVAVHHVDPFAWVWLIVAQLQVRPTLDEEGDHGRDMLRIRFGSPDLETTILLGRGVRVDGR